MTNDRTVSLLQGEHLTDCGLGLGPSAIAIIPVTLVFGIFQRQFISGLSSGALTG